MRSEKGFFDTAATPSDRLEAFRGRGRGDFHASSDLEDIITVLDGRPTVVDEVAASPRELRRYIGKEVGRVLDNLEFANAVTGHITVRVMWMYGRRGAQR
jgi:hypothetical protein